MQVKDLLDLLLVSAVLYVVLAWLRLSLPSGVARRSMVAAPMGAAIYVLADAFELWMAFAYSPDTVLRTFTVPIALDNLPED